MSSGTYTIAKHVMLEIKNSLLAATLGTAVMNSDVIQYKPFAGDLGKSAKRSLLMLERGSAKRYGL